VLGKSEASFLDERAPAERSRIVSQLCRQGVSCFVLTTGLEPPVELLDETERQGVPLLRTELSSSTTIERLTRYLEDRLAPRSVVHGVLLDVYGLGVLLIGDSGVGKSECAIDLVVRGHRLVSDDIVEIKRMGDTLVGTGPELTRYHMELRGVGIINVKDLFGIASTRSSKRVELVVQLERWDVSREYERLGIDDDFYELLGLRIPLIRMPVAPGRSIAILVEVAARNQLLRSRGHHAARMLAERLEQTLRGSAVGGALSPADGGHDEDDEEAS